MNSRLAGMFAPAHARHNAHERDLKRASKDHQRSPTDFVVEIQGNGERDNNTTRSDAGVIEGEGAQTHLHVETVKKASALRVCCALGDVVT